MTPPDFPKDSALIWADALPAEWLCEVGRIALYSAAIEEELHVIYWQAAGLSGRSGAVATGELRPNRLPDQIIKLMRITNDKKDRLDDLETLLSRIRRMRDRF